MDVVGLTWHRYVWPLALDGADLENVHERHR
jgi:hypothetical protein